MKKCPFCAELVQDEAILCRFCGRDLPATPSTSLPLHRGDEIVEQLKQFSVVLQAPIDKSPQGIASASAYLEQVMNRKRILSEVLIPKLTPLLRRGRPFLLGKDQWDRELIALLMAIKMQSLAALGEDIWASHIEVPPGCGRIWFYLAKAYDEGLQMASRISDSLSGEGSTAMKAAQSNWKAMTGHVESLEKEIQQLSVQISAATN